MENMEKYSRRVYKKSFLKNIQSVYSYTPFTLTNEKKKELEDLMKGRGFKITNTGDVPMVQGNKDTAALIVSEKGIVLSMDVSNYINFEHYTEYINFVIEILNIVSCSELTNFILQKVNLFKLSKAAAGENAVQDKVFRALFTKEVVDDLSSMATFENGCFYTVQPTYKDEGDYVVAKLTITALNSQKVTVQSLLENLAAVNDIMYDKWYRSTTDKVREIMEK